MKKPVRWFAILAALVTILMGTIAFAQPEPVRVPDAEQFVGAPRGTPLTGPALEQRSHEVATLLRCPVCQGLAIADSPSEMATNMKGQVRELLARGYTEAQILQYFERSYGQFVLLRPKFQGLGALVWIFPILAIVIGLILVALKARRLERATPRSSPEPEAATPVDDPYLERVRKLVEKP